MMLMRKKTINDKKVISFGNVNFEYTIIHKEDKKYVKLNCLPGCYEYFERDDYVYVKFLGLDICVGKLFLNRKQSHYKKRHLLTDEYCKNLLREELKDDLGYVPDIDNPKTLNEKILWLKFNDHNPLITKCCDKYAVKDYVSEVIGEKYVLPVIGVWKDANNINFNDLPNKFAIKVNWSSGFNIIVKDKNNIVISEVVKKLNYWMQENRNSYWSTFNWGYKHMEPVIFAEPYIEQFDGQVYDYKFFMVNGEFKFMLIATDRHKGGLTFTWFDSDFNVLPCTRGNHPKLDPPPAMPKNLYKMIELAKKLAKPFKFVRVDFYELNEEEIYVGEMTFYPAGGFSPFKPMEYDYKFGEYLNFV